MATIQHSALTTTDLHEPKGAAAATAGDAYISNGAGSGQWEHPVAHFGGYVTFDSATPAYTMSSLSTTDVVVNPTFIQTSANQFTATSTPNARMTYTGTSTRQAFISFNASVKQGSGTSRDMELVIYKNGTALEGSRVIRTTATGSWGSVALNFDTTVNQNDYFEVFARFGAGTQDLQFAQAYLGITAPTD